MSLQLELQGMAATKDTIFDLQDWINRGRIQGVRAQQESIPPKSAEMDPELAEIISIVRPIAAPVLVEVVKSVFGWLKMRRQNTRVVLVGASGFLRDPTNLPELPAVAANVEDLKLVLTDPQVVGIPSENIVVLLNELTPYHVVLRVADEARKAVDTFIFYYSGHGIVGGGTRDLYLTTENTTYENAEFGTAIWCEGGV